MDKEYKLIEELQKEYDKELSFKIYKDDWDNIGRRHIEIKNIYTIDNKIIDKIKEYTNDYYINVDYKKLGLIIIINIYDKNTENLVSNNI